MSRIYRCEACRGEFVLRAACEACCGTGYVFGDGYSAPAPRVEEAAS